MKICLIGLGYVGLPLAVKFGQIQEVNGFDINQKRIKELKEGFDSTNEINFEELKKSKINLTTDPTIINESDFLIITVPTPIDDAKKPDLSPLLSASDLVGKNLKKGSIIVYESTVYPGCTEKDCIPVIEKNSGMQFGKDFFVGYSPERINPGDKIHTVDKITKIISGSDPETLNTIEKVYSQIIKAGLYKASSIKVAEAAKIIENTQRDINIALMNELKMIFDKMNIDYKEVLKAAGTKWNFLTFTPGLVGGHCIGVDPYYLAYESERIGHHPNIILAGRRINDDMPKYEASRIIKYMLKQNIAIKDAKILILGATFKPNVPDTRNSKVQDLIIELKSYGCEITICEPFIGENLFGCKNIKIDEINKSTTEKDQKINFNLTIKAVNHDKFKDLKFDYQLF